MSDYFTYTNLTPNTVARASDVNTRFQGVAAGFDMLPPPAYLRDDRLTYSVATGTGNAILAAPATPILAYNEGLHITVKAIAPNTGAVTINVSGLGVKSVLRADGSALQTGDIVAGQILDLTYDGTNFRLSMAFADLSPAGVVAKLQAAGSFSLGTGAILTFPGAGGIVINGNLLDGLTSFGRDFIEAANATAARVTLSLGTMATESASNYALLASPALTGTPTAPTAAGGTNTTQIATTAFVTAAVAAINTSGLAPIASPTFTGDPKAPTPATADNDTSIATTAYVKANLATYATLASPTFTGVPAGPTAAPGTNTTQLATTAFVTAAVGAGGAVTTTNALTMDNSGAGDVSGTTFNGGNPRTISYNTIGAAPLASPALTGTPTAPTAAAATNTTQIATTAFVQTNLASKADLNLNSDFAGYVLGTTPNAGTTGGVRVKANVTTGKAYLQVISADALSQWGYWEHDSAGHANWGGGGEIRVGGATVATTSPRIQTAGANSVTPTFSNDLVIRTGATATITLNNPTGTAVDGHGIVVRLKDNGTARAINYGAQYRAVGVTLPTVTVINKWTYLGMIYNAADTKWDVVSVSQE